MRIFTKEILMVIILILLFLFQSVITLTSKTPVFDDPAAITIGTYFVKYLDTSMYILHPPLIYILAGLPLQFVDINLPYSYKECTEMGFYKCSQDTVFESNNDVEKIGTYSKIPFIVISLILGLILFFFAKELYGKNAGYFTLTLYAFSPTILGYNTIIFTDLVVTFFIVSATYFLWKLLIQGYTKTRLIFAGIFLGLALASKFTAILLIPIIVIFFIIKIIQDKNNNRKIFLRIHSVKLILILLIGLITLHASYFFSFGTITDSIPERYLDTIESEIGKRFPEGSSSRGIVDFLVYDIKIPIPQYFAGIAAQNKIGSSGGKKGYLNGEIYEGGKWYYFFEVLLIKTQIPLIIFFITALIFTLRAVRGNIINELFILIPIIFFLGVFLINNFNLGLRHILPIFPFVFLLSSRIVNINLKNNMHNFIFKTSIVFLLLWYILITILIMPNYAAYFNELVGGPKNGHYYLLSSNLDMGQDLKKLSDYIKAKNLGTIKLSYHGSFDPSYYNISYEPLPMEFYIPWVSGFDPDKPKQNYKENCSKKQGIMAISVSNLHNYHLLNKSCFKWLNDYSPIKKIGYTIFIYNVTD